MKPVDFELSIQELGPEMVKRLRELMQDPDPSVALRAIKMLQDRGYGIPNLTSRDPFIDEQKDARLNEVIQSVFDGEEENDDE